MAIGTLHILALQEEPPSAMFQERPASVTGLGRRFANLVPPSLAATTLSFMKEVKVLSSRKQEARGEESEKGSEPAPSSCSNEGGG